MKTTNYYDTFIAVAEDCSVTTAEAPPVKNGIPTVASIEYALITANPYKFTSDDVLFQVFANRGNIAEENMAAEREKLFAKSQACLRASPLGKRYGWGIHSDQHGRIALYALESKEYKQFASDKSLKQLKAMRSKHA